MSVLKRSYSWFTSSEPHPPRRYVVLIREGRVIKGLRYINWFLAERSGLTCPIVEKALLLLSRAEFTSC